MAQAYPNSKLLRLRLPRAFDRPRARRGAAGGRGGPGALRSRQRQDLPRPRLRPRHVLRLPARHGRSGGRLGARAAKPACRRHLDDRRALRRRPARGQPEPGRPHLLFGLDLDLHASLARAGSRAVASARRPAKRGCARSSPRAGSRASGARPRRRSTWSSKRAPERAQGDRGARVCGRAPLDAERQAVRGANLASSNFVSTASTFHEPNSFHRR